MRIGYKILIFLISILVLDTVLFIQANSSENQTPISSPPTRSRTIIVDQKGDGNFTTILGAIESAQPGDKIRIWDGIYYENVLIQKPLILVGNGTDSTFVIENVNMYVFKISSNNISISHINFTNNVNENKYACLDIERSENILLEKCSFNNAYWGVHTHNAHYVNITTNEFYMNQYPMYLGGQCENILIQDNYIINSEKWGIVNIATYKTKLYHNIMINTSLNLAHLITDYDIKENTINGVPLIYKKDIDNVIINKPYSQYIFLNCSNIIIKNVKLVNIYFGIVSWDCNNVLIENVTMEKMNRGIDITGSSKINILNSSLNYNYRGIYGWYIDNISINMCKFLFNDRSIETNFCDDFWITNNTIHNSETIGIETLGNNIFIQNNKISNCTDGIDIKATSSLIKNNTINQINNKAIAIGGSSNNLEFTENLLFNVTTGIYISINENVNISIKNSRIKYCQTGIFSFCYGNVIESVIIENSRKYGLDIRRCKTIGNSTILNGSNIGIFLNKTDNCNIVNNTILNNHIGISAYETDDNLIYSNFIIENDENAVVSNHLDRWNLQLPIGGNYWSDYSGKDIKRGTQQSDSGSDGFGDIPYYIDGSFSDKYPIFIDQTPPIAVADTNATINLGEIYHFDASGSYDDQLIHNVVWEWDYGGEHKKIELMEFNFQFDIAGVYDCELTVSDFAGNWDTDTITITVEDSSAPIAATQGNLTIDQGELAYFSAVGTTDLSPIVDYIWTFEYEGEEVVLKGMDVSYAFNEIGVHYVLLEVVDSEGNSGYGHFYVTVMDIESPVSVPGPDIEIENGDVSEFDGSGSTDNDVITEFVWTFKYSGNTEMLFGETATFSFTIPGYYTVTLTVTDANENSHSETLLVTVIDTIDPEPVITGRTKLLENDPLSLDGLSSTDNGKIVKYIWNFTDGEDKLIESPYLNHTFLTQGHHNVTLTVFDQWDNSAFKTVTVEVPDTEKPKASAGDDMTVKKGTTVTLDGSSSTDNGGISSFKWKFDYNGEDQVLDGKIVTFTFDKAGEYEIELTVTDHFLNRGTDKIIINVLDNGTLSGTVLDGDGQPIQGAKVTVTDSDGTDHTATTGTDGSFSISVPEGQVTWTIEKSGYDKLEGTSNIQIMEITVVDDTETVMKRTEDKGSPFIVIVIIILVIVILCGLVLGVILLRKRKNDVDVESVEQEPNLDSDQENNMNTDLNDQDLNGPTDYNQF